MPLNAYGISFDVSFIAGQSGGGGTYLGLNFEHTDSGGWGLYRYKTPGDAPSFGFLVGPSIQINVATGGGDWTGRFDNSAGSYDLVTAGSFVTSPGEPTPGYFGYSLGIGRGLPGVGYTTTDYEQIW
jgi:hypothetical protein